MIAWDGFSALSQAAQAWLSSGSSALPVALTGCSSGCCALWPLEVSMAAEKWLVSSGMAVVRIHDQAELVWDTLCCRALSQHQVCRLYW